MNTMCQLGCFNRYLYVIHLRVFHLSECLCVGVCACVYIAVYVWTVFIKGIKNGCPCIVEISGTQGCALVGDPARAVGECRDVAKAQP